jgi:uncharacterized ParB-like nuclease family protein
MPAAFPTKFDGAVIYFVFLSCQRYTVFDRYSLVNRPVIENRLRVCENRVLR